MVLARWPFSTLFHLSDNIMTLQYIKFDYIFEVLPSIKIVQNQEITEKGLKIRWGMALGWGYWQLLMMK